MFSFLSSLFTPAIRPFDSGFLPEDGGHRVFYRQFGNKDGMPVLFFHGGPGSFSKEKHAKIFDLKKHRVILFDQRGCGQSTPAAETANNTTADLVRDAKRLLDHLGIEKTFLYGGSWGSTMALLFAETYPHMVTRMVVAQIFLARQRDAAWLSEGSGRFFPDILDEIKRPVPTGVSMRDHYADVLQSGDAAAVAEAVRTYGNYERATGQLAPVLPAEIPDVAQINSFRIYFHYDSHDFFLRDNQIIADIEKISHIPTVIIHNRIDMVCPPEQAWELARHMKNARLVFVPEFGHVGDKIHAATRAEIKNFL